MESSRGSSSLYVTPRGVSTDDMEATNISLRHFYSGQNVQKEAPEQKQQGASQEQHWVDQQQWELEQQQQYQQYQQQQQQYGYPQWQQGGGDSAFMNADALNQAAMQQLQQNTVETEDLSKMVGEGEWQRPPATSPSWDYTRALSSYTGFTSKRFDRECSKLGMQTQTSGIQMRNSGIYVPGVTQWNAVTNTPVEPLGGEARTLERRKFTFDATSGNYVNAHDPSERIPADRMHELQKALSNAAVEETVVDIMRRRSTLRKMSMASRLFLELEKKKLSAITGTQGLLPPVVMAYLPDGYIKTYDRTNCMSQRISMRQHKSCGM
uniref:Uncharacterized protein n=1 Tax=Eimeria tenella TaxID=5802 RepID=H9BA59_EIMTE|nr:hypothetical protein [Eimeria tenella]